MVFCYSRNCRPAISCMAVLCITCRCSSCVRSICLWSYRSSACSKLLSINYFACSICKCDCINLNKTLNCIFKSSSSSVNVCLVCVSFNSSLSVSFKSSCYLSIRFCCVIVSIYSLCISKCIIVSCTVKLSNCCCIYMTAYNNNC